MSQQNLSVTASSTTAVDTARSTSPGAKTKQIKSSPPITLLEPAKKPFLQRHTSIAARYLELCSPETTVAKLAQIAETNPQAAVKILSKMWTGLNAAGNREEALLCIARQYPAIGEQLAQQLATSSDTQQLAQNIRQQNAVQRQRDKDLSHNFTSKSLTPDDLKEAAKVRHNPSGAGQALLVLAKVDNPRASTKPDYAAAAKALDALVTSSTESDGRVTLHVETAAMPLLAILKTHPQEVANILAKMEPEKATAIVEDHMPASMHRFLGYGTSPQIPASTPKSVQRPIQQPPSLTKEQRQAFVATLQKNPQQAAEELAKLDPKTAAKIVDDLPVIGENLAAKLFSACQQNLQVQLLRDVNPTKAILLLRSMPNTSLRDQLFQSLTPERQQELRTMEQQMAADARVDS